MEQFTLISTIIIESDLEANICLRPSNSAINDLIASYKVFENEQLAINGLNDFLTEQTPLLFANLQIHFPTIASNYYL